MVLCEQYDKGAAIIIKLGIQRTVSFIIGNICSTSLVDLEYRNCYLDMPCVVFNCVISVFLR